MGQEQFVAMLPYISADLVRCIADQQKIPPEKAVTLLYSSELYAALEQEETKLWQYSTMMLYSLFLQEQQNGFLDFPDV